MFFSEKENGSVNPTNDTINCDVYNCIIGIYRRYSEYLAMKFPEKCTDNGCVIGFNSQEFYMNVYAIIPSFKKSVSENFEDANSFDLFGLLDFIELCYKNIVDHQIMSQHAFFNHYHLTEKNNSFTKRNEFRDEINLVFQRNGISYKLGNSGEIERILPLNLDVVIKNYTRSKDDKELNDLIDLAIKNIIKPKQESKQIALEKLWDAFERIKTHDLKLDKRKSVQQLVNLACEENNDFRNLITNEFIELSKIGNNFRVRHHETDKTKIESTKHIDYLFYRMMSILSLVLNYL